MIRTKCFILINGKLIEIYDTCNEIKFTSDTLFNLKVVGIEIKTRDKNLTNLIFEKVMPGLISILEIGIELTIIDRNGDISLRKKEIDKKDDVR